MIFLLDGTGTYRGTGFLCLSDPMIGQRDRLRVATVEAMAAAGAVDRIDVGPDEHGKRPHRGDRCLWEGRPSRVVFDGTDALGSTPLSNARPTAPRRLLASRPMRQLTALLAVLLTGLGL